jgi:hypothetical protein
MITLTRHDAANICICVNLAAFVPMAIASTLLFWGLWFAAFAGIALCAAIFTMLLDMSSMRSQQFGGLNWVVLVLNILCQIIGMSNVLGQFRG